MKIAVFRIISPRPENFDRRSDGFRQFDRFGHIINKKPPTETAAHQRNVNANFARIHSQKLGGFFLRPLRRLRAHPDFAAVGANIRRAVHRLQRRVRLLVIDSDSDL